MQRRTFIKRSAIASTAMMLPSFLKPFESFGTDSLREKSVVIIQLSGGNDGLNTIVPYTNDLYYNARPQLAINSSDVIKISEHIGFNPAMQSLQEIHDQGLMTIINNVGYPNPDRSHFRSMDIWQTASDSSEYISTGWIGRFLDSNCNGCGNPHTAIEVDDTLSLALKGLSKKGLAIRDVNRLYSETTEPFFKNVVKQTQPEMLDENNLGYLYKTIIETYSSVGYIYNTSKTFQNNSEYPDTQFARQLKTVSQFIQSGLSTRVYYVSIGSFDTHVGQQNTQTRLLKEFADGVAAFLKDLKKGNHLDDVLVMTFSEFGRRVNQNASNGTDHGTANNIFVFGNQLKKNGFYNDAPNLNNLEEGDLKFEIDFRNVYATVLEKWLKVSNKDVLMKDFDLLNFV